MRSPSLFVRSEIVPVRQGRVLELTAVATASPICTSLWQLVAAVAQLGLRVQFALPVPARSVTWAVSPPRRYARRGKSASGDAEIEDRRSTSGRPAMMGSSRGRTPSANSCCHDTLCGVALRVVARVRKDDRPAAVPEQWVLGQRRLAEGGLPERRLAERRLAEGSLPERGLAEGSLPNGALPKGTFPNGALPNGALPNGAVADVAVRSECCATPVIGTSARFDVYDPRSASSKASRVIARSLISAVPRSRSRPGPAMTDPEAVDEHRGVVDRVSLVEEGQVELVAPPLVGMDLLADEWRTLRRRRSCPQPVPP